MKKLIAILIVFFVASTAIAQSITSSAHDFSGETWNNGGNGEICITCHTPHNADGTVTGSPLWNHEVTSATFTLYNSSTFDATIGQPNGASKLCLSCHDGTVAVDNFGGSTGGTVNISAANLLGTDLSNDHPVSFTYNATLATTDGGLYDPTTASSGLGGTITDDMLFAGEMQCASCHNAHDNTLGSFLKKSNATSALCLTCHNK
ncbi:MAG: cytochrome c3 family protein [Melioribacteraceae bacterium]|nr:cytochrome c3 family protein [Melioribacteraceae bacterium]